MRFGQVVDNVCLFLSCNYCSFATTLVDWVEKTRYLVHTLPMEEYPRCFKYFRGKRKTFCLSSSAEEGDWNEELNSGLKVNTSTLLPPFLLQLHTIGGI